MFGPSPKGNELGVEVEVGRRGVGMMQRVAGVGGAPGRRGSGGVYVVMPEGRGRGGWLIDRCRRIVATSGLQLLQLGGGVNNLSCDESVGL